MQSPEDKAIDASARLRALTASNYAKLARDLSRGRPVYNIPPPPPLSAFQAATRNAAKHGLHNRKLLSWSPAPVRCNALPGKPIIPSSPTEQEMQTLRELASIEEHRLVYTDHEFIDFATPQDLLNYSASNLGPTQTNNNQNNVNGTAKQPDDLIFCAHYEGGNLLSARRCQTKNTYALLIRPDAGSRSHCQWFDFIVRAEPGKTYTFVIMNFVKRRSGYQTGMKVLQSGVFENDIIQSNNINDTNIQYNNKDTSIKNDQSNNPAQYTNQDAACQPCNTCFAGQRVFYIQNNQYMTKGQSLYSYSTLYFEFTPRFRLSRIIQTFPFSKSEIDLFMAQQPPKFTFSMGTSRLRYPIHAISFGDTNANRFVLIVGRAHPGEPQGSHVAAGAIQALAAIQPNEAPLHGRRVIVVPMLNPDGVFLGNYRCDAAGIDLNRDWGSDILAPELQILRNYVEKEISQKIQPCGNKSSDQSNNNSFNDQQSNNKDGNTINQSALNNYILEAFIDLHGHFVKSGAFGYANGPDRFFDALNQHISIFNKQSCKYALRRQKRNTARAAFAGNTERGSYCIEFSYYGTDDRFITVNDLQDAGKGIVEALKYFDMNEEEIEEEYGQITNNDITSKTESSESDSDADVSPQAGIEKLFDIVENTEQEHNSPKQSLIKPKTKKKKQSKPSNNNKSKSLSHSVSQPAFQPKRSLGQIFNKKMEEKKKPISHCNSPKQNLPEPSAVRPRPFPTFQSRPQTAQIRRTPPQPAPEPMRPPPPNRQSAVRPHTAQVAAQTPGGLLGRVFREQWSEANRPRVRVVYESRLDIELEKRRFDYAFYGGQNGLFNNQ